jgi:aerobic-type carbon monoxide dehydrogenase small subunit (CoxS/CutS family)
MADEAVKERVAVALTLNGTRVEAEVEPRALLSDVLREVFGLTGVHVGCEHGVCGACTVLLDGEPVRSCLLLAAQAEGHAITTVEGLGSPDELDPLQEALWREHGLQCGYCTPGVVLTAKALLARDPRPSADAVRDALSGNLCRCTGYQFIVDAVLKAAGAAD